MQHGQYDGHGLLQSRAHAKSNGQSRSSKVMLRAELCPERNDLAAECRAHCGTCADWSLAISSNSSTGVDYGAAISSYRWRAWATRFPTGLPSSSRTSDLIPTKP